MTDVTRNQTQFDSVTYRDSIRYGDSQCHDCVM
jgi:hypothetical protein